MPKGTPALRNVVRPKYVMRESLNCILAVSRGPAPYGKNAADAVSGRTSTLAHSATARVYELRAVLIR